MNYADPNDPNGRRQKLISAMTGRGSTPGATPLFGGGGRSFAGGFDLPAAALPSLSFNPFLAQQNHGIPNLAPPTQVTQPDAGRPNGGGPPTGPQSLGTPADNYAGMDGGSAYDPNQVLFLNPAQLSGGGDSAPRRLFGPPPTYGNVRIGYN